MGIHDGHRKNLRQNFLQAGLEGKSEHQVLELLLTFSIPRIDVNPIAHELINRFGSFAKVIDADPEELLKIPYITENTVVLLKLIPELAKEYNKSRWGEKPQLLNMKAITEYMRPYFEARNNEAIYMMCFDNHFHLLDVIFLAEGTPDEASAYIRTIVSHALRTSATQIILAHNHPSGHSRYSMDDLVFTNDLNNSLKLIGIKLLDHIVFAGNRIASCVYKENDTTGEALDRKIHDLAANEE